MGKRFSQRAKELNEKRRKTNLERYGVEWAPQREDQKRIVGPKTSLRYIGQEAYDKLMDKDWLYEEYVVQRKSSQMIADDVGVKYYGTVLDYVRKHGFEFEIDRRKVELSTSSVETKVMEFIRSLGASDVEQSNREIIHPLELDVYIPSHNWRSKSMASIGMVRAMRKKTACIV